VKVGFESLAAHLVDTVPQYIKPHKTIMKETIGIVGAGITGLATAYVLSPKYDVVIIARDLPGDLGVAWASPWYPHPPQSKLLISKRKLTEAIGREQPFTLKEKPPSPNRRCKQPASNSTGNLPTKTPRAASRSTP